MKEAVIKELQAIESEANVRVLLAVESGSRAWGFASPDSDYDVRFIYVHEADWYSTIFEDRDVIEKMLPGDLDVSGWELRKSLRLFSKCNLALNEWIGSPVLYHDAHGFRSALNTLIPAFFNPMGAIHHYKSMAKQSLSSMTLDGRISIKKFLYATRALLACRWIERYRSQPPTEFLAMVSNLVPADDRSQIEQLLLQKSQAAEEAEIVVDGVQSAAILSELDAFDRLEFAFEKPTRATVGKLDSILRHWAGISSSSTKLSIVSS
jgi:predicted nucleotidyltransferase